MGIRIVGGIFKGRVLETPPGLITRPTSQRLREAVFNICQHEIEGADFLDLFAGTGAMGFEALSRRARSATFVEKDPQAVECLKKNLSRLPLEEEQGAEVIATDVLSALRRMAQQQKTYALIYVDPPYGMGKDSLAWQIMEFLGRGDLLHDDTTVFLEESSTFVLPADAVGCLQCRRKRKAGRTTLYEWIRADYSSEC